MSRDIRFEKQEQADAAKGKPVIFPDGYRSEVWRICVIDDPRDSGKYWWEVWAQVHGACTMCATYSESAYNNAMARGEFGL